MTFTTAADLPKLETHDGPYGPEVWATPRPPEGARLVSHSELQSMDCWLKHHYSYGLGLKPVTRYIALQLGSAWDAFYNTWHGGPIDLPALPHYAPELPDIDAELLPPEVETVLLDLLGDEHDVLLSEGHLAEALAAADYELRREAVKVAGELTDKQLPLPLDWDEQLAKLRTTVYGMALHYVARWGHEDDTDTLGVQVRFAVPLPSASGKGVSNKFYLHGVIDRLALHGDELWVIDAKLRMGTIEDDYRDTFERDPQLALYGWALRQAGWPVVGGYIDATSAVLPRWPQLKQQPETVYELNSDGTPVLDADGKQVAVQEPVPCPACDGAGEVSIGEDTMDVACEKCSGEGVARFASGARKGEVKTRAKKQPALYAGWENLTTLPVALAAIQQHGLPDLQYAAHLAHLGHVWAGRIESRFHWRMDREPYRGPELERASASARGVAGYLDTLPPVPMPSKMKCKYCSFRDVCPSAEPADFTEGFTTREQRKAISQQRRAAEQAEAELAEPVPAATPAATLQLDAAFSAPEGDPAEADYIPF